MLVWESVLNGHVTICQEQTASNTIQNSVTPARPLAPGREAERRRGSGRRAGSAPGSSQPEILAAALLGARAAGAVPRGHVSRCSLVDRRGEEPSYA